MGALHGLSGRRVEVTARTITRGSCEVVLKPR